jgi:hypothetical protein
LRLSDMVAMGRGRRTSRRAGEGMGKRIIGRQENSTTEIDASECPEKGNRVSGKPRIHVAGTSRQGHHPRLRN